ncbi:hypothetical protein GCM10023074_00120 [Microbispora amethystogenes]|uniref:Uncharacterized protein n=1 Tax=Microbispora amethystogenes TaxID=1427754 RepID=A0ABQ4FL70_9ACTN|nr:hypothetical protein Mam01_57280 [Microbispora amethystogenes]
MPENSPTPRHRRGSSTVLALTGAIGVTAIAGLGVVLAVMPGQDLAASSAAHSPTAGPRFGREGSFDAAAPGIPGSGPFFSQSGNPQSSAPADISGDATLERPKTAPDIASELSGDSAEEAGYEAAGDGTAEQERSSAEQGALPPGHETGGPGSPGRAVRATGPSRPPAWSARLAGNSATGSASRSGTRDADRRRSARTAPPEGAKPVTHEPDAQGSTDRDSAARGFGARGSVARGSGAGDATPRNPATGATPAGSAPTGNAAANGTADRNTAGQDAGAGTSAASRAEAAAAARTRMRDACLRFHDLRRAYCYQVLRRFSQ